MLAMHIAATNPVALDLGGVSRDVLEREKAILAEKNAGKPDNVLQRIFESGLKSFAKETRCSSRPMCMTVPNRWRRC